jgi:hypothetical protein
MPSKSGAAQNCNPVEWMKTSGSDSTLVDKIDLDNDPDDPNDPEIAILITIRKAV